MNNTLTLTREETERLTAILSCHIDLNLVPTLKTAATNNQIDRIIELSDGIKLEQELLQKLYALHF